MKERLQGIATAELLLLILILCTAHMLYLNQRKIMFKLHKFSIDL